MRRVALLAALAAALLGAPAAHASLGPIADVKAAWAPTDLPPGGEGLLYLRVRNLGDQTFSAPLEITDQLPAGVTATAIRWRSESEDLAGGCSGLGTGTIECQLTSAEIAKGLGLPPGTKRSSNDTPEPTGWLPELRIEVAIGASPPENSATNLAKVEGGGAPTFTDTKEIPFGEGPFGLIPGSFAADVFGAEYPAGSPSRQAGDHPFEQRVNFEFSQKKTIEELGLSLEKVAGAEANGLVKDIEVALPRGMVGNPEALPKCNPALFAQAGSTSSSTRCPSDTQLGYLGALLGTFGESGLVSKVALYNLVPPKGTLIDIGFVGGGLVQGHIFANLDPAHDYAIRSFTPNIGQLVPVAGSEVTVWGVPADPAHDRFRFYPEVQESGDALGARFEGAPIRPFYTDPMDCGTANGAARFSMDSYEHPAQFSPPTKDAHSLEVTGCNDERFRFKPEIELKPTDQHAGAPTGLKVDLKVEQRNDEAKSASELYAQNDYVKGISTPPLKKAVVTFPEGMTLSPSAAQGLGSCTLAQLKLGTNEPVECPDSSQYGTLSVQTPNLAPQNQPHGFIYIARQNENPFHDFLALYLVIEEPERGVLVKVPGEVSLNPVTGQITTEFDNLPQFPVSDFQMNLKSGVRAGLVEPQTCGEKTIKAEFFSWQAPSAPIVKESSYDITQNPDGSPCVGSLAERPFAPSLRAGTLAPTAGEFSPFAMHLTRTDEDQELSQLGVKLPMGLAAKFAGVSICPEAGIAQALSRETVAGDGALEQADPSCPQSSEIGTTMVGAGVGVPLSWVPGKVYLAGPYKGAPISLVVISPAIVGPYDLGVITVRTALYVNPETAQGEALSDPLPQIFQGIPVRIRDIRLKLDRPGFTLNPTSCEPKVIEARLSGLPNASANPADRFQAADCASLGFHPHLAFHLYGKTNRGAHPRLKAVVKMPRGGANIARASVALPSSEFLDQNHLNNICTRVQFKAKECPKASIYGWAKAKTPLFGTPLEGPVYLRSSSHLLPDLVAALKGPASQPVEVDLDGRIDSVNEGIRNTFELVPDAPVETFTLEMQGGSKGLLVNSTDLCAKTYRAAAVFGAQNGRRVVLHPSMGPSCPKPRRKGGHGHRHRG